MIRDRARRRTLHLIGGALTATGLGALPARAVSIAGIPIPDTTRLTPDGPTLLLNGAGERKILLFQIYAIGLYLAERAKTLEQVLAQPGPKRLYMVMLRNGITSAQVHDHVVARLTDGTQPHEMAVMKQRMDELDRIIQSQNVIDRGGTIAIDYLPAQGTLIRVNDGVRGEPIPGPEFYQAILRIWLGAGAKSAVLRDALLGRG